MNDPRTTVHHAILDLYELRDYGQVYAADIVEYTGMPIAQVDIALCALEASGSIATDDAGVIVEVQNAGYFPTAQRRPASWAYGSPLYWQGYAR